MDRSGKKNAGTLVYPKHCLTPHDLLTFSEMSGFVSDWEDLKLDVEFDLLALQVALMARPKAGPVIQRTGGLRKLDFAPPDGICGKKKGKRNSCRVCYVYFEEFHTILLVMAYAKNRKDDLSEEEKRLCKQVISRIQRSLSSRHYHCS